ncbi:hypothetical protein J7J26_02450 [Candidatus Micrarchaeota archaeon]|nr:hypothetical protein [Candidatus Micrarchaeota archaeon]
MSVKTKTRDANFIEGLLLIDNAQRYMTKEGNKITIEKKHEPEIRKQLSSFIKKYGSRSQIKNLANMKTTDMYIEVNKILSLSTPILIKPNFVTADTDITSTHGQEIEVPIIQNQEVSKTNIDIENLTLEADKNLDKFKNILTNMDLNTLEQLKEKLENELLNKDKINNITDFMSFYVLSKTWAYTSAEIINRMEIVTENIKINRIENVLYVENEKDEETLNKKYLNNERYTIVPLNSYQAKTYKDPKTGEIQKFSPFRKVWGSMTDDYVVVLSKDETESPFTENSIKKINDKIHKADLTVQQVLYNLKQTVSILKKTNDFKTFNKEMKYKTNNYSKMPGDIYHSPLAPQTFPELIKRFNVFDYKPIFKTQNKLYYSDITNKLGERSSEYTRLDFHAISNTLYCQKVPGLGFTAGPTILFLLSLPISGSASSIKAATMLNRLGSGVVKAYFGAEGVIGTIENIKQKNWLGAVANASLPIMMVTGIGEELVAQGALANALGRLKDISAGVLVSGMSYNLMTEFANGSLTTFTPEDISNIVMSSIFIGLGIANFIHNPSNKTDVNIEVKKIKTGERTKLGINITNPKYKGKKMTVELRKVVLENGSSFDTIRFSIGDKHSKFIPIPKDYSVKISGNYRSIRLPDLKLSNPNLKQSLPAGKTIGEAMGKDTKPLLSTQPNVNINITNQAKQWFKNQPEHAIIIPPKQAIDNIGEMITENHIPPAYWNELIDDYFKAITTPGYIHFDDKTTGRVSIAQKLNDLIDNMHEFNMKWEQFGIKLDHFDASVILTDGVNFGKLNDFYTPDVMDNVMEIYNNTLKEKLGRNVVVEGGTEEFLVMVFGKYDPKLYEKAIVTANEKVKEYIKSIEGEGLLFNKLDYPSPEKRSGVLTFSVYENMKIDNDIGETMERNTEILLRFEKLYDKDIRMVENGDKLLVTELVNNGMDRNRAQDIVSATKKNRIVEANLDKRELSILELTYSRIEGNVMAQTMARRSTDLSNGTTLSSVNGNILKSEIYEDVNSKIMKKTSTSSGIKQSNADIEGVLSEDWLIQNSDEITQEINSGKYKMLIVDYQLNGGPFTGRRTVKIMNDNTSMAQTDVFIGNIGRILFNEFRNIEKGTPKDELGEFAGVYRTKKKNFIVLLPANANVREFNIRINNALNNSLVNGITGDIKMIVKSGLDSDRSLKQNISDGLTVLTNYYNMGSSVSVIDWSPQYRKLSSDLIHKNKMIQRILFSCKHIPPEERPRELIETLNLLGLPKDITYNGKYWYSKTDGVIDIDNYKLKMNNLLEDPVISNRIDTILQSKKIEITYGFDFNDYDKITLIPFNESYFVSTIESAYLPSDIAIPSEMGNNFNTLISSVIDKFKLPVNFKKLSKISISKVSESGEMSKLDTKTNVYKITIIDTDGNKSAFYLRKSLSDYPEIFHDPSKKYQQLEESGANSDAIFSITISILTKEGNIYRYDIIKEAPGVDLIDGLVHSIPVINGVDESIQLKLSGNYSILEKNILRAIIYKSGYNTEAQKQLSIDDDHLRNFRIYAEHINDKTFETIINDPNTKIFGNINSSKGFACVSKNGIFFKYNKEYYKIGINRIDIEKKGEPKNLNDLFTGKAKRSNEKKLFKDISSMLGSEEMERLYNEGKQSFK